MVNDEVYETNQGTIKIQNCFQMFVFKLGVKEIGLKWQDIFCHHNSGVENNENQPTKPTNKQCPCIE